MDYQDLQKIQKESTEQVLPQQKKVLSAADKIRRKTSNLPDPTHPPMGWKDGKGYDHIFPWIHLPRLHPKNHLPTEALAQAGGDTVIFNEPQAPANQLILGDNLEVLRTLPTMSIDLIYIDPPFFSGRNYNVIWGDTNEVRSFYDVWEGGIDSYLVWLNARLWEMRRVLTKTGSIYVHCDWHASHYIKTEMDKIFGYDNLVNEIIWHYGARASQGDRWFQRKHDTILWYSKSQTFKYNPVKLPYGQDKSYYKNIDEQGRPWRWQTRRNADGTRTRVKTYLQGYKNATDVWDIPIINGPSGERIGYPTQKPIELMQRIIEASSDPGDIIADFFMGGGSFLCAALGQRLERESAEKSKIVVKDKLRRYFIGSDSSRVAISVTLDRLVKIGEEMSGVRSNVATIARTRLFGPESIQLKIQTEGLSEKVPNIEVSYLGVYPTEKFTSISQDEFCDFVLTCYGASKNTAQGMAHGFRPPGQSEPIFVGPTNPNESVSGQEVKAFFDEIKSRLETNKLVSAKIIGWRFDRQIAQYIKILEQYIYKHNLPMKIELIPLDSREFRTRILQRYPDADAADFFLRFSKAPVIGDIKVKKVKDFEYEFEAIDALSTNEDGWLVNCQWDFDYQAGHFAADKEYVLSREKVMDKKKGERFKAALKAKHTFERSGEYTVACKVQDNLAGETIFSKKIEG